MSTIKVGIGRIDSDGITRSEVMMYDLDSSWYTAQNYFNDHLKDELLDDNNDIITITLRWLNKNYVFKRKIDDDKCHKKGR